MGDFKTDISSTAGAHLRILATSDVHMHMTGWDARQGKMATGTGLDQLSETIRTARATAAGATILLDNGDILQGTAEGDVCAQPDCSVAHPWPAIANALGYDAVGLGNHDFDFGLPFLETIARRLGVPVLCASLSEGEIKGVEPGVILHVVLTCSDGVSRPMSIGVFSILPPQTLIWNHKNLAGQIAFDGGVTAAMRAVASLRAEDPDLIIALCHSGLSTQTGPDAENFSAQVAREVPGLDAIIMGHTHRRFPGEDHGVGALAHPIEGTLSGIPAVMPEYAAQSLGVIDLALNWQDNCWSVTNQEVKLLPAGHGHADPAIAALAAPSIAVTRALMDRPVSETGHHIHSYFNALQTGTEHALVARAMTRVIADRVAGSPLATLPLIASVSSSAVGGHGGVTNFIDVPQGPILARHVAMVCPYQNEVWAAVLTGADLLNWAERGAVYFGPKRDSLTALANPDAPFFSFDTLMGMDTIIDPFAPPRFTTSGTLIDPAAQRILALRYDGVDVAPETRFLVAMSSYRGAGGGAFPGLATAQTVLRTEEDLAKAIHRELRNAPLGTAPAPTAWRFAAGLNQDVLIETSPAAVDHLAAIASFNPRPMGYTDAGFLQIRVTI